MDTKAQMGSKFKGILFAVITLIIVFQLLAATAGDVGDAADNITTLGADTYPLVSFFKKKGIILLAFIAGIIISIFGMVLKSR